jgi:Na+/phosphate symporter
MKFNKWQSVDGVTRNAVLQVVSSEISTNFTSTSTSFVDVTDMSLAITPTSATSKILVSFNVSWYTTRSSTTGLIAFQILRDSTVVFAPWVNNGTGNFALGASITGATVVTLRNINKYEFLDNPNTTNQITYKLQGSLFSSLNSASFAVNETSTSGLNKSVITLMEIAQ